MMPASLQSVPTVAKLIVLPSAAVTEPIPVMNSHAPPTPFVPTVPGTERLKEYVAFPTCWGIAGPLVDTPVKLADPHVGGAAVVRGAHLRRCGAAAVKTRARSVQPRALVLVEERIARGYRSSPSSSSEAGTDGLTGTSAPDITQALWLGANRGASSPSLISR